MKVVAVIPCLNEATHIGEVVRKTKNYVDEVVVADDNSSDNTMPEAQYAGAKVCRFRNAERGSGANMRRGVWVSLDYQPDIIVLLDGDGQHNPNDIPALLSPILKHEADVVLGDRMVYSGMPKYRAFGNRLLSLSCNVFAEDKVSDPMTGFWAIRTDALPDELTEQKWGAYTELLMKCRQSHKLIVSVPVRVRYHETYSENSSTSAAHLFLNLFAKIIKWRLICKA